MQRGNDKKPCFLENKDRRCYLAGLVECSTQYQVHVHAYVLMTNHVHLLVTPASDDGVSRMMQQLGRKYVTYFNKAHERTGTLWEGRFRSSVVASTRYFYACHRYIEMNPVRAHLAASPDCYEWSSYRANALGQSSELLHPNGLYIRLGKTKDDRLTAYRRMFIGERPEIDNEIRQACQKGKALE
jgi:putative transposase